MIKKSLLVMLVIFVILITYHPIVLFKKELASSIDVKFSKGQVFTLRQLIHPTSTGFRAYIIADGEEIENINPRFKKHKVLKTTNATLINELLDIKFKYTDSDVATIGSKIIIYSGNEVVFRSSISLESTAIGLQNRDLGWVVPTDSQKLLDVCSRFDDYYMPILHL